MLPDGQFNISENELFVIPQNVLHYTDIDPDTSSRINFSCIINGKLRSRIFRSIFFDMKPIPTVTQPEIRAAFTRMNQYWVSKPIQYLELIASCVHEILYLVYAIAEAQIDSPQNEKNVRLDQIYKIDQYINANLSKDITLKPLADSLHLCEHYTNQLIKKAYGRTFRQQVIFLRMSNATKLLEQTQLKVKDIAEAVGYTSLHGFYYIFEKAFHMTPEEYRRSSSERDPETTMADEET